MSGKLLLKYHPPPPQPLLQDDRPTAENKRIQFLICKCRWQKRNTTNLSTRAPIFSFFKQTQTYITLVISGMQIELYRSKGNKFVQTILTTKDCPRRRCNNISGHLLHVSPRTKSPVDRLRVTCPAGTAQSRCIKNQ